MYRSLEIDQFLITSHFCCETFQSHDGNVIEIDGFNKKSGSYILECSNIEHKDETIQAKVTCIRISCREKSCRELRNLQPIKSQNRL